MLYIDLLVFNSVNQGVLVTMRIFNPFIRLATLDSGFYIKKIIC